MIKLSRLPKPTELTDDFVATQTLRYKNSVASKNPISVWNHHWLKKRLLESSSGKCAYCECQVNVEGNYMEVEHFKDKSDYPDDVLIWENLLPSCKRCNVHKSEHDVIAQPIINPFDNNPADHLYMQGYRIKGKTTIGKKSVEVLYLNETAKLVQKRFEIGEGLESKLEMLPDLIADYNEAKARGVKQSVTKRRNKLTRMMKDILQLCQPHKEYAATCATVVHLENNFTEAITFLQNEGLWDDEFNSLFSISKSCVLSKNPPKEDSKES